MATSRPLIEFLLSAFRTPHELLKFTEHFEINKAIPGANVNLDELANAAVTALEARGLLDAAFWKQLADVRPNRAEEIRVLQGRREQRTAISSWILTWAETSRLVNLLQRTRVGEQREQLRIGLPPEVGALLTIDPGETPLEKHLRLLLDIERLNSMEGTPSTVHPLQRWLENAAVLAGRGPADSILLFAEVVSSRGKSQAEFLCRSSNHFRRCWGYASPDLRATFGLASALTPRSPDERADARGVKTRYFYQALCLLNPDPIGHILKKLPEGSFERASLEAIELDPDFLLTTPRPSHCIATALTALGHRRPADRLLHPVDVFVEICQSGVGESVKQLHQAIFKEQTHREPVDDAEARGVARPALAKLVESLGLRPI